MSDYGLTEDESKDWCKSKSEYLPLLNQKHRTKKENTRLQEMAEQYRDWNRRIAIDEKHLKFNPKVHTSEVFRDLTGYTGGAD